MWPAHSRWSDVQLCIHLQSNLYDLAGNLTGLQRYRETATLLDSLTYTNAATSNRLTPVEVWTGSYIFENEWQSFRTRRDRSLELITAQHIYPRKGKYGVAVKVIDIFGNDTTSLIPVSVG